MGGRKRERADVGGRKRERDRGRSRKSKKEIMMGWRQRVTAMEERGREGVAGWRK